MLMYSLGIYNQSNIMLSFSDKVDCEWEIKNKINCKTKD